MSNEKMRSIMGEFSTIKGLLPVEDDCTALGEVYRDLYYGAQDGDALRFGEAYELIKDIHATLSRAMDVFERYGYSGS